MTTKNALLYDNLTLLIQYPDKDYQDKLKACQGVLHSTVPATVKMEKLDEFVTYALAQRTTDLEEMYTRTFDFDPDCALELGWHLYGENYGRGDFLVKVRHMLQMYGIEETAELPDHLIHILPAIGRLEESQAREFAVDYVIPGIDKLLSGITKKNSPYEGVLQFVQDVLRERYAPVSGGKRHE